MKLVNFQGINNVADPTRLKAGEMLAATNVDIGARGILHNRRSRELVKAGQAGSLYRSAFGLFARVDSDLLLLNDDGTVRRLVYETLGYTRVWFATLPDGRVAFSNGLIQGLATATETTTWGVPEPVDAGAGVAGGTMYQVTYRRNSDGLEGAPTYGALIDPAEAIIGLPVLPGFTINVYFAPYGGEMFFAGSTDTDTFQHDSGQLGEHYVGSGLGQPPVGAQLTTWGPRVLLADGSVLWLTEAYQPELCNLTKNFLQFPDRITGVYANDSGVFIGTPTGVYFLAGDTLADLKPVEIAAGAMVLGSVVELELSYLQEKARPKDTQRGALCLIDGAVHLMYGAGQLLAITPEYYRTDATEVHATVRLRDGVMQYLAAPA